MDSVEERYRPFSEVFKYVAFRPEFVEAGYNPKAIEMKDAALCVQDYMSFYIYEVAMCISTEVFTQVSHAFEQRWFYEGDARKFTRQVYKDFNGMFYEQFLDRYNLQDELTAQAIKMELHNLLKNLIIRSIDLTQKCPDLYKAHKNVLPDLLQSESSKLIREQVDAINMHVSIFK